MEAVVLGREGSW